MNLMFKFSLPAVFFFSMLSAHSIQAQEVLVQGLNIVASNTDVPMGQSANSPSLLPEDTISSDLDGELFGLEGGGYFHPYLSVGGEYTDNLFNIDTNETDNFLTTITPGIWMSLPSRKEVPLKIAPNNTSAGGLQAALDDFQTFDRMNIYLLGGLNYRLYSSDSDLNDYDARLEGLFKYNLRGGLSLQIVDAYNRAQDRFDVNNLIAQSLRQYYSNIILGEADWELTEKLRTKLELSNFYLKYDDSDDAWLNRSDNALSWYGFFKYSLKTSLFVQYRYVDVSYDERTLKDSSSQYIYGGINWLSTDKTSFRFKLGYQKREFNNSEINDAVEASDNADNDALALQLALDYQITTKSKVIFTLSHDIEETDSFDSLDKTVLAGNIHYEQEFNNRFTGLVNLRYENADYTQFTTANRDDDRYVFTPALQYTLKDWLMARLSYTYDTRNSTLDLYEYDTNIISLTLNSAL